MPTTIKEIAGELESWAPRGSAESWDNVGLHIGDPSKRVSKGLLALDITPQVLAEAISVGAELVVTHHPLFFKPVSHLTPENAAGHLALKMAEAGVALYCIHTNLDVAKDGVSYALARQLGLSNVGFLSGLENQTVKLVSFVPSTHLEAVKNALSASGTGQIGNYDSCSFSSEGTGSFRALDNANPTVGKADADVQNVNEFRLEVELPRFGLNSAIQALLESHPYEEVAYDVYPVEKTFKNAGLGAIGELDAPLLLAEFLERVSVVLENPSLRYVGDVEAKISRVAVCGGSGSQFIETAQKAGADAYVTADITYHRFFETLDIDGDPKMALIDPGHYESEKITEQILFDYLTRKCPEVDWTITSTRTAPVETYVRRS